MAPNFLSNLGNTTSAPLFDIRLAEENLILKGTGEEATGAILRGTLVLCLTEPLRVQGVTLKVTCESKICFPIQSGPRAGHGMVRQDREHFDEDWAFVKPDKGQTEIMKVGNYEYPFEAVLPGEAPESIEGLDDSHVIYRIKATVLRGRFAKDLAARKHFRVIRTFDTGALELSHVMNIENVWPDKMDYCISTPAKAVIFGTNIQVDFKLIPLLKGLSIGRIEVELMEIHDMTTELLTSLNRSFHSERVVSKDVWTIPEETEAEEIEGTGQEGFVFSRYIAIPKSLKECLQTVEVVGIKIKHKLKFNLQLHNPDGHVSELRAQLPIHIFISPNLPINENNELVTQDAQAVQTMADISRHAPPLYGEHHLDQLYSDVDPSGYMTPAEATTPYSSQSRNGSSETLASMADLSPNDAEVSANTLRNRLSSLTDPVAIRARDRRHGSGTNSPQHRGYSSPGGSREPSISVSAPSGSEYFVSPGGTASGPGHTSPLSRSNSDEAAAPQHIERAVLSRVPSYNTALQTPVRTPCSDDLPTYQTAVSRPSTPPIPRSQSTTQLNQAANLSPGSSDVALPALPQATHGRISRYAGTNLHLNS